MNVRLFRNRAGQGAVTLAVSRRPVGRHLAFGPRQLVRWPKHEVARRFGDYLQTAG